jgi:sugar lactone lactonase YvrE
LPGSRVILDGRGLLECPRWRDGWLYMSDFALGEICRLSMSGTVEVVAEVPTLPGGLGWTPEGELRAVSMYDLKLLGGRDGRLEPVADLSIVASFRTNDMVMSGTGVAYIGQFGYDLFNPAEQPRRSPLIGVTSSGTVFTAAADLFLANGLVITDEGRTLLVAETLAHQITSFAINSDGTLGRRDIWAPLPEGARPDGICLDAAGCVWIACTGLRRYLRVARGGRVLEEITADAEYVFACALGGPDGRTLFMLMGDQPGRTAIGNPDVPRTSGIVAAQVDVPGVPGQP